MTTAYDLLAAHPFLVGLTDWQLERLSMYAQRSFFHSGNRIFRERGYADRFWLIQDGRVHLDLELPDRGDVVVETLGPGTVLGWSWMFPPYRWHFGAVAVETTLTVEVDGAGVRQLCERDPQLGYELTRRFTQVVIDRMQATRMRLLDLPARGNLTLSAPPVRPTHHRCSGRRCPGTPAASVAAAVVRAGPASE